MLRRTAERIYYYLLRTQLHRLVWYTTKVLTVFPPLRVYLAIYGLRGHKALFPPPREHFFKEYSTGRYQDSRVALIQMPGWGIDTPPLSTASLSAYLRKQGYKVMPVDANIELYHLNRERYERGWRVDVADFWNDPAAVEGFIRDNRSVLDRYTGAIIASGAKVIGFTVYDSSYLMSLYLAREIKSRAKDRVIVFGGPQASVLMAGGRILEDNPEVDFVAEGEGEETLLEIVKKVLGSGGPGACAGARGRNGAGIAAGPGRKPIADLDALPFPDFSDFDFRLYRHSFRIPIASSRGCVNRCIYCNERPFWGRYRSKSGEHIFEEVKSQLGKYPGVFFFDFQDSLVNGDMRVLEKFCDLIILEKVRIVWIGQAIVRKEMNYELYKKLRRSGCLGLAYGLETASPALAWKIGKTFSKGTDTDRLLADSKKAGVGCALNFMFGLPGETDEDAGMNIDFIKRNAGRIAAVNPSPSFCAICPGTPAYEDPGKYGIDLAKGAVHWESADGSNTYSKRREKFKRFTDAARGLGIPSVSSLKT